MKKLALLIGLVSLSSCSPATVQQDVKTVLDIAVATCVAEHPDADEPTLAKICAIAEKDWPLVRNLLASTRAGARKLQAASAAGPVPCK